MKNKHLILPVVILGLYTLYNVGPLLMEPLRATILAEAPHARLVRLEAPPVAGAVLLGMLAAGCATDAARPVVVDAAQAAVAAFREAALQ